MSAVAPSTVRTLVWSMAGWYWKTFTPQPVRSIDMRFGLEITQSQIGAELGLSQMHVSRVLKKVLRKLRTGHG